MIFNDLTREPDNTISDISVNVPLMSIDVFSIKCCAIRKSIIYTDLLSLKMFAVS